jgi:hypothetical protein
MHHSSQRGKTGYDVLMAELTSLLSWNDTFWEQARVFGQAPWAMDVYHTPMTALTSLISGSDTWENGLEHTPSAMSNGYDAPMAALASLISGCDTYWEHARISAKRHEQRIWCANGTDQSYLKMWHLLKERVRNSAKHHEQGIWCMRQCQHWPVSSQEVTPSEKTGQNIGQGSLLSVTENERIC